MTMLFGYEAKLILDLDGEPYDATHLIEIDAETTGKGIHIDAKRLIWAIQLERGIRRGRAAEQAKVSNHG